MRTRLHTALADLLGREPTEDEVERVYAAGQAVAEYERGKDGWRQKSWAAMEDAMGRIQ